MEPKKQVKGTLSGGGHDDSGVGNHVVVDVGNGRKFTASNTWSNARGTQTQFEEVYMLDGSEVPSYHKGEVVATLTDRTWTAYERFVTLSNAAGDHRVLDDLVSCRKEKPRALKIAKYVDTSHSSWGKFKEIYRVQREKKRIPDKELLELFKLFNKCALEEAPK